MCDALFESPHDALSEAQRFDPGTVRPIDPPLAAAVDRDRIHCRSANRPASLMRCRVRSPAVERHVLGLVGYVPTQLDIQLRQQRGAVGFDDSAFQVIGHGMRGDEEVEHVVNRRLAGQAVEFAPRLAQHRRGVRQFEKAHA